jgi:hypothetical protein
MGGALRLLAVAPDQPIGAPADEQPSPLNAHVPAHTVASR